MNFYDAVDKAIKIKGIRNFSELCRKADDNPSPLFPSFFSKLKSGHTQSVSWDKALQIIRALDMTPDEFLAIQDSDKEE